MPRNDFKPASLRAVLAKSSIDSRLTAASHRPAFAIREFHLKMILIERHDDSSNLTAPQLQRPMGNEMRCRNIFR
jgi:hypothetical protein